MPRRSNRRKARRDVSNGHQIQPTQSPDDLEHDAVSIDIQDITDSDATESEDNTKSNPGNCKPKLQIFKGCGDKISIENWLKRFEMLAKYYKWSENSKIVMIGNYLEDDALNWYIENSNDSYYELKVKLNNRFGIESVEPIVEFVNIRYNIKSGIKEYFENKRRYGNLAKLTEEQMIPIMINNLHPKMTDCFTAVKPKTFSEFYTIAKTAENNLKRFMNRMPNTNTNNFINDKQKQTENKANNPNKRKPPNPCRICENLGFKNRFHWSNECRNKCKQNPQNIAKLKAINSIESNSEENSEENDIKNINLN